MSRTWTGWTTRWVWALACAAQVALAADSTGEPNAAVWIQPVGAVALASAGVPYVPVGFTVPTGNGTAFSIEASFAHSLTTGCGSCSTWWQGIAAVGPQYRVVGERMNGLWIEPKLLVIYTHDLGSQFDVIPGGQVGDLPGQSLEAQLAVDVMGQVVLGPVFISAGLGVGAGYCLNCANTAWTSLMGPALFPATARTNKPTFSVNLNLLRIGYAF